MPRPRTPLLSTERIADAAMELVDDGEPFGVNAIARRLGVTPSSLYNHVAGRDEIVELMRARMADRYTPPLDGTWDDVVERMLRAQRRMYADHSFLIPLIVHKTITDPSVIASYDRLATVLVEAGFPDDDVLEVVGIIDAFSIGMGLDLASPDDVWAPGTPTETLGRLVEAGPRGVARSDRAFEAGLDLLLDGLRLRLARYEAD